MGKPAKPSPGAMAFLVGEALRAGGVEVGQTKEKFGSIRVYVEAPNSHAARCHYREVYLNAMWACPALAENLRGSADYPMFLFDTEQELDAYIAKIVQRNPENVLAAWDTEFRIARALIRGENTDAFNTSTDEE